MTNFNSYSVSNANSSYTKAFRPRFTANIGERMNNFIFLYHFVGPHMVMRIYVKDKRMCDMLWSI
jgi:hypothetical protein